MKKFYVLLMGMLMVTGLMAQNHGYPTRIDSVQFVDDVSLQAGNVDPIYFAKGDTITVEGIVTFNPLYYGMSTNRKATWLQDTSLAKWGGINVFIDPNAAGITFDYTGTLQDLNDDIKFYENFIPGYKVKCTGILNEYQGNTQLNLIPIESEIVDIPTKIDTTEPIHPTQLTIDVFSKSDGSGGQKIQVVSGQPYEGMYVRFNNVVVVDLGPHPSDPTNRKIWSVQDEFGNKLEIRDNSGYFRNDAKSDAPWINNFSFNFPSIGTRLAYVQGVIGYSTAYGFQLSPLLPSDIFVAAAAPFISHVSRYPVIPTSSDKVKIQASITDNDGKVVSAKLHYSVGAGNNNFNNLNMSDLGGGVFAAYIPAQSNNSLVNFYLSAVDDSGYVAYFPDSLATGSNYTVLDGGITTIEQIKKSPSGTSPWKGDTLSGISIEAIVTSTLDHFSLVSIQDNTTPWSGIFLTSSNGEEGISSLKLGDKIRITSAYVTESYGVTILAFAGGKNMTVLSHNNPLPDPVKTIDPDSINAKVLEYSEAYEGMYLEFDNIYLTSNNPDDPSNYGEWAIGYDTNAPGLRVDDYSKKIDQGANIDSFLLGQQFSYFKGILYYSFGNYKFAPRDWNDIDGFNTLWVPHADFTSDVTSGDAPLTISFKDQSSNSPYYLDYNWVFDGGSPETSTEQNPQIDYNLPGSYAVKLVVSNKDGEDSISKSAYILITSIDDHQQLNNLVIFPNPVSDYVYITGNQTTSQTMHIAVYDATARLRAEKDISISTDFLDRIDLKHLDKGIYWIKLSLENGKTIVKPLIKN